MDTEKVETVAASTFAQRFEFTRDRQRGLGTWQDDGTLAGLVGVAASQITEYKARAEAPATRRTLALAKACGVDPGWLAFGEDCDATPPAGFAIWFANKYAPPGVKHVNPAIVQAAPRARKKRRAR